MKHCGNWCNCECDGESDVQDGVEERGERCGIRGLHPEDECGEPKCGTVVEDVSADEGDHGVWGPRKIDGWASE